MNGKELQTACIKILEERYNAYVINLISASVSGHPDILACINGRFYGLEIKGEGDTIKPLQQDRINKIAASGGKGYFIRSVNSLIFLLNSDAPSHVSDRLSNKRLKL